LNDGKQITSTDVDLIFNKVKTKSERKINFRQFQQALCLLAEKQCASVEEERSALRNLLDTATSCPGPILVSVTKANPPKLNTSTIGHSTTSSPRVRHSMSFIPNESISGNEYMMMPSDLIAIHTSRYSLKPESSVNVHDRDSHKENDVFNRLTDSGFYTGTQKQRFQNMSMSKNISELGQ
jgi:hypothetical protein